jgi:hypothetical protein
MLRTAVGAIDRWQPRSKGGSGGAEFVNHRILGEDIDVMPALHQSPHGAQFGRDGAATVDEREQVRQRPGGPIGARRPARLGGSPPCSRMDRRTAASSRSLYREKLKSV